MCNPEITFFELSSYNSGYHLPFTIELYAGMTIDEYRGEMRDNLKRLDKEVREGKHGKELQSYHTEGCYFEEWIVCDYEGIPSSYVSEWSLSESFFEVLEADIDMEVLEAYTACFGTPSDIDNVMESYEGHWNRGGDFAYDLFESCGYLDDKNPLVNYIDWEKVEHELMFDYSEHEGHYFRAI